LASGILGRGVQTVVVKLVIGEKRGSMAVKAVGTPLTHPGLVFGHEELETSLFFGGELGEAGHGQIELGTVAGQCQEELLEGEGDLLRADFWGPESFGKKRRIGGF
jgi:hypothetical protein